jgi:hypothetical protein
LREQPEESVVKKEEEEQAAATATAAAAAAAEKGRNAILNFYGDIKISSNMCYFFPHFE